MTKIYIDLAQTSGTSVAPFDVNVANSTQIGVGVVFADLLDDAAASTGVSLSVTAAFNASTSLTTMADTGVGEFNERTLESVWYTSNGGTSSMTFANLPSGSAYTLQAIGHSNSAGRHTQFTVEGVAQDYIVGTAAAPTAPVVFTGNVDPDGEIVIDITKAASGQYYGYLNGFILEYATGPSYTITSIDSDNDVQAGQSNVDIVTSGIDPASSVQAVTLGGETLTINSWTDSGGDALINLDIPADIDLEWGTTHELAVTHDGGTTTLSGVTLSAPTGWEAVSFSTIPDTGTTESFYEYSQSDVTVGNFTAQVGDTLAFTSSTGLTIDGSSIPVVDPAATVSGSYKWWDASLSTWTPVSSYTVTNLGVFGGSDTTVMIQEMISDMISEMVN